MSGSTTDSAVHYDPFDRAIINDPYPVYRRLRHEAPVYWSSPVESWVLSRHHDVLSALTDHATYSSANGVFPTAETRMTDVFLPMLIMTDPPRHTRLRALVSKAFTRRHVAALEDRITALVRELLAGVDLDQPWDLVAQLAGPLPAIVIADMLGVPPADRDQFRRWSSDLVQADPTAGPDGTGMQAAAALYTYFATHLAERRRKPREDLMTTLVQAKVDGSRLSDEEVLGFCLLLLVAGHETTTNLLSNAAVVLADHPAIRSRLTHDPHRIPAAVEELLRFDSPVQALSRTLTRDVRLHNIDLAAGDSVLMLFGSANRDESAFPHADTFDPDREPGIPVAFGRGIHFCLGAPLARLEATLALEGLLRTTPTWTVDLDRAQRLRSGPIRGFSHLPIRRGA